MFGKAKAVESDRSGKAMGRLTCPDVEIIYLFNGFAQMRRPRLAELVSRTGSAIETLCGHGGAAEYEGVAVDSVKLGLESHVETNCAELLSMAAAAKTQGYEELAVAVLCHGAALSALGMSDEATACFEWICDRDRHLRTNK